MRIQGKLIVLLLLFSLLIIPTGFSQTLPESLTTKIDSLFTKWDSPVSPGCAIGIVRNDSLIYAKGYGMANLEYAVPNTPKTIFHMASVSKQFTAYTIVLLARQGKLKLEGDIRKYLPWFPDLKEKITIRQLLNHTSGVRDQWQLLSIAGTRTDDVITQDHIIKLLSKQRALNFKPGTQYSYSNSGYTMLAEIVKSVTGQSLRKFTDSTIFRPLGMTNTHFHDDYTEIVKNRAYSYNRKDNTHFTNSILSFSNVGATSLFTNTNDMAKWITNFYVHKVGDKQDIEQLVQKGKLNSGKELSYALGIVVGTFKGWRHYFHSGGDAGYRTIITVFPDLKMGFIVFSNVGDFYPEGKIFELANLFIKNAAKENNLIKKETRDSTTAILNNSASFKKFAGSYISKKGMQADFEIRRGKLYTILHNQAYLLIKEKQDTFYFFNIPEVKFIFNQKAKETGIVMVTPETTHHLIKYVNNNFHTDQVLQTYIGTYYSPELDCKYKIILNDHHLLLTSSKYQDTKLTLIGQDHLMNDHWWMNHLKVVRNNTGKVTGFEVNSEQVMHLQFNKIE